MKCSKNYTDIPISHMVLTVSRRWFQTIYKFDVIEIRQMCNKEKLN